MIDRRLSERLLHGLRTFPVVGLLGPRQVGKTTLALETTASMRPKPLYLDLERDSDRSRLEEAELFLGRQQDRLVIIDEVQRHPELFPLLRSLIDERARAGDRAGQFLVLGSASRDALERSAESLAGRIQYLELAPLTVDELAGGTTREMEQLWLRGGLPLSVLAATDRASWEWRGSFISTYLERDIPQLGPRLPAERMRRLWTMLAFGQGDPLNAAKLAAGLGLTGKTVRHHLDVLTEFYMVRQLAPWSGNSRKRLVRSPKVYVRDSGLLHRLTNLPDLETVLGHPICGPSWQGFAIENIVAQLDDGWRSSFYRTSAGAEVDLILEGPSGRTIAIEIKRTLSPRIERGFRLGCEDVGASERFYVIPSGDRYPLDDETDAIALPEMVEWIGRQ